MATFENVMQNIAASISIKDEDRKPYTEMFDTIRNWLMMEMCKADPLFAKIFKGTSLFGSYPNRVRIILPSEFDVSILLELDPLNLVKNKKYPGFVKISRNEKPISTIFSPIFKKNRLNREYLKEWIKKTIHFVLHERPLPKGYDLKYTCCRVAHTIYVQEKAPPFKSISIDFVPSVQIRPENLLSVLKLRDIDKKVYLETFLAIPHPLMGIKKCGIKKGNMFRLVNPEAERDKIWDKQNLKVAYRLLKSMRDKHELKNLKSYFFTTIFLLEVNKQPATFWHKPISDIFLHMLNVLIDCFHSGRLPFYWTNEYDLLFILRYNTKTEYLAILQDIYKNLLDQSLQSPVSYGEVVKFFKTSR